MRSNGIDIGGDNVRLHFVGGDLFRGRAVMHGIEQIEKFPSAFVLAHEREGHRGPNGAVRVLAAILAHTGNIAFDVAGIERRFIKGRIEELDQFGVAPNEALVDGVHGLARALPDRRRR